MFVGLTKNPRHPPLGSAWKKSTRALHPPRFNVEAENDAFQVWFISGFPWGWCSEGRVYFWICSAHHFYDRKWDWALLVFTEELKNTFKQVNRVKPIRKPPHIKNTIAERNSMQKPRNLRWWNNMDICALFSRLFSTCSPSTPAKMLAVFFWGTTKNHSTAMAFIWQPLGSSSPWIPESSQRCRICRPFARSRVQV